MNRNDRSQDSSNLTMDVDFDDAHELSAKAALALKLNELIDQRGLSQVEAASITGMTQPKVSQVRRNKLQNISLERLMQALWFHWINMWKSWCFLHGGPLLVASP